MVKSFKEHVASSLHPSVEKAMERHADEVYQGAYPDLPHHGNFHFNSAVNHVADRVSDHFRQKLPSNERWPSPGDLAHHVERIAHKVVSKYSEDDTKESKANDKKRERAYQKSLKAKAKATPKPKNWDDYKPFSKARKGTGSY